MKVETIFMEKIFLLKYIVKVNFLAYKMINESLVISIKSYHIGHSKLFIYDKKSIKQVHNVIIFLIKSPMWASDTSIHM